MIPSKTHMAAYLAGFIDGEGTLTITRHTRKDRPGYKRFNIRLAVYNTNLSLLKYIQSHFGGTLMIAKRSGGIWKDQGQLAWAEEQIVEILELVRPFLFAKRKQAEILLECQATKLDARDGRKNGLSPEVVALRELRYTALKRLNARGKTNAIENAQAG